jgi:hypothetical protein
MQQFFFDMMLSMAFVAGLAHLRHYNVTSSAVARTWRINPAAWHYAQRLPPG